MKATVKTIILKLRGRKISEVTKWALSEILNDLNNGIKPCHSDKMFLIELCKNAGLNAEYNELIELK